MSATPTFEIHESIQAIADRYEGFILDQFGVLHNGTHGLDGAPECVAELSKKGKKLIILSNSSSPSSATVAKLPKLGFDPTHFVGAVTSGQETTKYVAEHYAGKKAVYLTWRTTTQSTQVEFLEKCGNVQAVETVPEADFVLLHGVEVWRGPGDDTVAQETTLGSFMDTGDRSVIDPLLQQCADKGLPMICANPDFIMVRPDGTTAHMPGKIASRYEELGGKCTSFGKPHAPHFEACVQEIGLPKDKVVHVGDSLHHDIAGANASGIDSIFVVGGVHREELGCDFGALPSKDKLSSLFAQHGQTPTHVVPMFKT